MASVAQIRANRLNAQKSTGPRTAEGKAAASQNAAKHGLLAEQVVIKGEDPAEFEGYRDRMLEELAPVGAVETMLAERAAGLAWRLRRAERLQSAVFATVYRENADDIVLWPKHGLPIKPGPGEDEVVLGQVVMTDFARSQILDRLLVYERRIENSLYRTMAALRKERQARVTAGQLASFGADATPEAASGLRCRVSSAACDVSGDGSGFTLETSDLELGKMTPCGPRVREGRLTVNAPAGGNQGRDALATGQGDKGGTPSLRNKGDVAAEEPSCETNPISAGDGGCGQAPTAKGMHERAERTV